MDRGQPGFRAQRKRRLGQAEEGHPELVGPVDHRWSGTSFYEQWELVRIRQIWGQIRLGLQKDTAATEWRCVEGALLHVEPPRRSFPAWDLELHRLCSRPVRLHPKYLYGTFMSIARVPCQNPQEGAAQTSVSPLGDKVQGPPKASPRPPWDESLGRSWNPGSHRLCCCQDSGAWEGERPEGWGPVRVSQRPSPGASPGWPGSK